MNDQAVIEAVGRINAALSARQNARGAALQAPTPQVICADYHAIEPDVKALLPVIALIPVYGGAISGALGVLMKIADALCPVS